MDPILEARDPALAKALDEALEGIQVEFLALVTKIEFRSSYAGLSERFIVVLKDRDPDYDWPELEPIERRLQALTLPMPPVQVEWRLESERLSEPEI